MRAFGFLVIPICGLSLLCSCTTRGLHPLPADVPINKSAGHGGFVTVPVQMADGTSLWFCLDTGSSGTGIDSSLVPKLGQPVGHSILKHWGAFITNDVYAMPKLFLGGAPLPTNGLITVYDTKQYTDDEGRHLSGILSYDCLQYYCLQFDFAAGRLRFLDARHADKSKWGKAFPIVPLNDKDSRPSVAENLLGLHGPHSLIDSGFTADGWLMTNYFAVWTNTASQPAPGEARRPGAAFAGARYPLMDIVRENVESDGIGLGFLSRHLVTLDFPNHTMYLARQTIGPLPDPNLKTTPMPALDSLVQDTLQGDTNAAGQELIRIENSHATDLEKAVARNLTAAMIDPPNLIPANVAAGVTLLPLGDARPAAAEVGWLHPALNHVPLSGQVPTPLLDSGQIYATGLFAHSPSRYVYTLDGKWKRLRGEAGLHTAFQDYAAGVVFVIKADGKELYRSETVHGPQHPTYDVDLTGVKTLELMVEKAGDDNGGNWALWLDPMLTR